MKRYDEYTPEDIEDLARECERLAEKVSLLQDEAFELINLSSRLLDILQRTTSFEELDKELIKDLPRIGASPRREHEKTPLDSNLPF